MNHKTIATALFFAAALGGCSTIETTVRSYGAVPAQANSFRGTYYVRETDEEKASLERAVYTSRVRDGLSRNGFHEASDVEADYAVRFIYYVRVSGQQATYTPPLTTSGAGAFAAGFNAATATAGGRVSSSEVCTRYFAMRIYPARSDKPLYERQARSIGRSCDLGAVLPAIIDAAFDDFPGEPGKTYTVNRSLN